MRIRVLENEVRSDEKFAKNGVAMCFIIRGVCNKDDVEQTPEIHRDVTIRMIEVVRDMLLREFDKDASLGTPMEFELCIHPYDADCGIVKSSLLADYRDERTWEQKLDPSVEKMTKEELIEYRLKALNIPSNCEGLRTHVRESLGEFSEDLLKALTTRQEH